MFLFFLSCHYYYFKYISQALTFPKDITDILRYSRDVILYVFFFMGYTLRPPL